MTRRVVSTFVVLSLLLAGTIGYVLTSGEAVPTYTVTADVDQAPNLFEGGRVMVRGVEVGEIKDVEPRAEGVRLTIEIEEGIDIPADATLAVIPVTVISDRYVQLFPAYEGSGPTLADGDHIPVDRTTIPAELDDVLTELKGLLSALEPRGDGKGSLARLIENVDAVMEGNSENLAGTLSGSSTVLQNLAKSGTNIQGLIANLDEVFVTLAGRASEIGLVNERFQLVAQALLADQANLESTTENLAFLSDETAGLLGESGDEIGTAFGRLATVLDGILVNQDELADGIRWSNVIAESLGAVDRKGKGLYAYSGRQAPPGTERASYNYRIDTRDTVACERIGALVESFKSLNPRITAEQVRISILNFIPLEYRDDITFILDLLIPVCSVLPGEPQLAPDVQESIRAMAAEMGEARFRAMVADWALSGILGAAQ
jgi:phospholipid/cholesterol/gamma-HCH transport system substrate-binding protein